MTRFVVVLFMYSSLSASAWASLSPLRDGGPMHRALPTKEASLTPAKPETTPAAGKQKYILTEDTEVLLDGQPCRYQDVPRGATIVKMDVAADQRTILTIHFRSKK